ncbi:hypothetical protein [Pedobacter sp. MR2016-24]|uniref:hypothetical protein n=1 Tax=Pedobacter sp. MR2016-24 TaxID=2994466 RepID=UPI002248377B|nr:hypothetical protein [Pedobacter sp. MR2016-24]MCX2485762.1 hypothetical protein [Pedobacter sp. MR2016-24]
MNRYEYKNLVIEILNDPLFTSGSTDNVFQYSKCYYGGGAPEYQTSKHGIKIYSEGVLINDCIVIGSGGGTGIYDNSTIVNCDEVLVCCCNTVFCLSLSNLELKWQTMADEATCFTIHQLENDYIVYGELTISRLDREGNIIWSFGGADIFVSIDNEDPFKLESDHIALTDFNRNKYKIDFDGKLISYCTFQFDRG